MSRKALTIGVNYVGTDYALAGCVNDAEDWARLLKDQKFDVHTLIEKAATRQAIMLGIGRLVGTMRAGDVGVVTYSGHGTWVPDVDGDEPDGQDEAICPYDMGDDGANLILDDELRSLYADVPRGATLVTVFDSCHSGTAYRFARMPWESRRRSRFVPPTTFARSATLKVKVDRAYSAAPRARATRSPLPGVVYFAACRDAEYAIDAEIADRPRGAFSYFAIAAFNHALNTDGTYRDVFAAIRQSLPNMEFVQTPQLSASPADKSRRVFS